MAGDPQPWRSPDLVAGLAAAWHARLAGRRLMRLAGGPGWLRLTLIEDSEDAREDPGPPAHLYLMALPGAVALWDAERALPHAWDLALGRVPQKQLTPTPYLKDAILDAIAAPADDRIVYFSFTATDGARRVVAHQLFGPRGNLALADAQGKRLWSAHPSPHPATLDPPPAPVAAPEDDPGAVFRARGPDLIYTTLREGLEDRARTALRRARAGAARHRDNLRRDLDTAERGDEARRDGETLAMHLYALTQGPESVTLPDAEGEDRTIALDPSRTPAENVDACFKRAGKADRGRERIAARLEEAEARLVALAEAERELETVLAGEEEPLEALPAWRARHEGLLGEAPKPGMKRRVEAPTLPFRRYRLDDTWDVWVGRSNKENDELTHHAASPDDWWFHAQGVPGSHVILRAAGRPDQIPRRVLERAAAIAAYHSKARTSGLAPVVYTLRKYVRKPRKSPAGTAACIREKSLMVEPKLPPETDQ